MNQFKVGDRVFAYDFGWERKYGTLMQNDDGSYYVHYDDGEECLVLNFDFLYHADEDQPQALAI